MSFPKKYCSTPSWPTWKTNRPIRSAISIFKTTGRLKVQTASCFYPHLYDRHHPIPPTELKQWQDEGRAFHLLDVRTDEERAICTLPAAIHIPMNLIPLRQNELPDDDLPIVVYCHHGIRSLHTAMYLEDAGFENLYNLQGGIDAWAEQIDAKMMRY